MGDDLPPPPLWAVAVPCHLLVSLATVYLLYWFVNMMRLPPLAREEK